jgi:U3 small nucleolar RNA-associated protein 18
MLPPLMDGVELHTLLILPLRRSESGVVNVYDADCLKQEHPSPIKAIMNLTTKIDSLTFNHDGQILAMGSQEVKRAVRMVNNTYCVYS